MFNKSTSRISKTPIQAHIKRRDYSKKTKGWVSTLDKGRRASGTTSEVEVEVLDARLVEEISRSAVATIKLLNATPLAYLVFVNAISSC